MVEELASPSITTKLDKHIKTLSNN